MNSRLGIRGLGYIIFSMIWSCKLWIFYLYHVTSQSSCIQKQGEDWFQLVAAEAQEKNIDCAQASLYAHIYFLWMESDFRPFRGSIYDD